MEHDNYEHTGRSGYQRESTPGWFLIGIVVLLIWFVYYLVRYWGGLGPEIGY